MNMFHDMNFIYNNPFVFLERFGQEDFFQGEGKLHPVRPGRTWWETNFVPDARSFQLAEWKARGAGGINLQFNLADNNMHTHISEFPVATYKKAHGHAAGAQIIILEGSGFTWSGRTTAIGRAAAASTTWCGSTGTQARSSLQWAITSTSTPAPPQPATWP